jgi:hypothetical protein
MHGRRFGRLEYRPLLSECVIPEARVGGPFTVVAGVPGKGQGLFEFVAIKLLVARV